MKKISNLLLTVSIVFLLAACSKSIEQQPANNSDNNTVSASPLAAKLTANKWNMMANGESYGTMKFNADGTLLKGQVVGKSNGTWKLEGNNLTISIPDEGEPYSGPLTDNGQNLQVSFLDGAINYTLTPAE